MELQWPLILFTTLVAWSAGLFGTQALLAAGGHAKKSQTPAWVASAVLLAAGGIAVFFHLEHWERIFNGFGHLTSGITQELIAIVALAAVAVVYLIAMRRSDDGATVPKWLCWLSVAVCVILVAVMAHSYTMAARPAWDSVLWILYVLGNACALGPCTMALIMALAGDDVAPAGLPALAGAAVGAVAAVAFAASLQASAGAFAEVGFLLRPHPPHRRHGRRGQRGCGPGAAFVGGRGPRRRRASPRGGLHGQEVFQLEALGKRCRGMRPHRSDRPARRLLRAGAFGVHVLLGPHPSPRRPAASPPGRRRRGRASPLRTPPRAPRAGAALPPRTPLANGKAASARGARGRLLRLRRGCPKASASARNRAR